MNRMARERAILEIVATHPVATQGELARELGRRGAAVTQATVSRDIAQLGLVKVRGESGKLVYARPGASDPDRVGELTAALRRWVVALEAAGALVVVRTPPGCANAVGIALDEAALPEIAGCIAGDDTIFLAVREGFAAAELAEQLRHHLEGDT